MPRDAVSRTANVERTGRHKWVSANSQIYICKTVRFTTKIQFFENYAEENTNLGCKNTEELIFYWTLISHSRSPIEQFGSHEIQQRMYVSNTGDRTICCMANHLPTIQSFSGHKFIALTKVELQEWGHFLGPGLVKDMQIPSSKRAVSISLSILLRNILKRMKNKFSDFYFLGYYHLKMEFFKQIFT